MKLADFDYNLPKELIAQHPKKIRDESRLLVLDRKKKTIVHRNFSDIAEYFCPGDLLMLNNTKVLPARVFAIREKTGAKIEILLVKRENNSFLIMAKPSKRLKPKETIVFNDNNGGFKAEVVDRNKITFNSEDIDKVYKIGTMPLPPYIKRDVEVSDVRRYQTIFARVPGSIAAPTAGLHFTKDTLSNIRKQKADIAYTTLHVGVGTFKPVGADDITQHKMEKEYFQIDGKVMERVKKTKVAGRRVFAVGTTTCRVLETVSGGDGHLFSDSSSAYSGWTDLFIFPGYQFKIASCLLTNFHLPKSTLFMLVCAFAGEDLIKKAYREAVDKNYRFYSYGDAMLII